MLRFVALLVCGSLLLTSLCGCRSTRMFAIDSDSRTPWFGLDLSLPRSSARRKTLETISNHQPQQARVAVADLRTFEPSQAPVRALLPKWLGGSPNSLPLPPDAPRIDPDAEIELQGPREEFR